MIFDTYEAALDYLYNQLPMYLRKGEPGKKNLHIIRQLCRFLSNPQFDYPVIHIAGTNGKGTVSHILAAMLQANGLKTGLYTSPHYTDYRERIRINGKMIAREKVLEFINKTAGLKELRPSFFELSVALAFEHFSEENVDVAVIETGLGGRLDSTNIVSPILSVITNIGLDHQAMLGETLLQIAYEKAGIIKPGTPLIIGERNPGTDSVFISTASEMHAPLHFAEDMLELSLYEMVPRGGIYKLKSATNSRTTLLPTDLHGPFQKANLTTALASWELLLEMDVWKLNRITGFEALQKVQPISGYKGRWVINPGPPLIIADSGHNIHSLPSNLQYLLNLPHRRLHIILGMVRDKDHSPILRSFPSCAQYYFTRPDVPRGLPEKQLREKASIFGLCGEDYPSVKQALAEAVKKAAKNDVIFIGGSTFVVADYLKYSKK